MTKRLKHGLVLGGILGIFCVIGAYLRSSGTADTNFLFSLWYNRIIIGLAIGAPWPMKSRFPSLVRGGVIGLAVSFAFFATSGFQDPISFLAGIIYGVLIEEYFQRKRL